MVDLNSDPFLSSFGFFIWQYMPIYTHWLAPGSLYLEALASDSIVTFAPPSSSDLLRASKAVVDTWLSLRKDLHSPGYPLHVWSLVLNSLLL